MRNSINPAILFAISVLSLGQTPDFHAESRLVTLDLSVTDRRTGTRVDGLTIADFEVKDEGRVQKITHFSPAAEAQALALYLVVDIEPIRIKEEVFALRDALAPALNKLRPDDQVGVLYYEFCQSGSLQTLTKDRNRVLDAFSPLAEKQVEAVAADREKPRGCTKPIPKEGNFIRALRLGAGQTREIMPSARTTFVVVTDDTFGIARGLVNNFGGFLEEREASVNGLVKVESTFSSSLRGLHAVLGCPPALICFPTTHYASITGGRIANVKGLDYASALEDVLGDITARYELGFVPDAKSLDGKFHKLTVTVKPPDPAKTGPLTIRYRREYKAGR